MLKEQFKFYENRIALFIKRTSHDYLGENIVLKAEYARSKDPVPYSERLKLKYRPIEEGGHWGDVWDSAWFHFTADVPKAWKGREIVCNILFSGEALVFNEKGVPEWSLTGQSAYNTLYEKALYFPRKADFCKGKLDLWVEAAANSLFGVEKLEHYTDMNLPPKFPGDICKMRLCLFNREVWHLLFDFTILKGLYDQLPSGDYRKKQFLYTLNKAVDVYAYNPVYASEARAVLAPLLARPAMASACEMTAVGHAHIDVGWLWPIRESIRKAARTYSSQLRLIDEYPGYVFGGSQPQLFAFMKEYYPELFERVKKAVKAGRIEPQGGMWVEADGNIISGESMIRQFMHGKNFFKDEFGFEVKSLWLPDVFGYSAALPQIIKKSGCDYFLTQKISWNKTNDFPYHSFIWEGIDGTKVLTHFPPENNYNAFCTADETMRAQNRYAQADVAPIMMSLFGIGDGGGGPNYDHIERAKRIRNLEGCPKYEFGTSASFFKKLEKYADKLPLWRGELYLEMHRGTLTTQARTKLNNRRLEQNLAALEFVASALPLKDYPAAELDCIWKDMLCMQFHDIIPGSSIHMVYENAEKHHADDLAEVAALAEKRLAKLGRKKKNAILAVNSLSCPYKDSVTVPDDWAGFMAVSPDGFQAPVQKTDKGCVALVSLPSSSISTITRGKAAAAKCSASAKHVLENSLVRYEFDKAGHLVSAFDKEMQREIFIDDTFGNDISLINDRPNLYDAWDVDITKDDERSWAPENVKLSKVMSGPVVSEMTMSSGIQHSTIVQTVSLRSDSKRLDFVTKVNWNEKHKLLRVKFPVAILAQDAAFDIQYGITRRPLNTNTSWEAAKFEVCGHRYADISENNFGVALLNNCKYGYRTCKGQLELTLLRSPNYPDPMADIREHEFTYSLLPHTGNLVVSNVLDEASVLNRKPLLLAGYEACVKAPFTVNDGNVRLEIVKRAEKSDRLVIRLVEYTGTASSCTLNTTLENASLVETNLIEWTEEGKFQFQNGKLNLSFKPFEIRTFFVI